MCSRKGNRLQVAAEADGFALDDDLVHVLSNEDDGGERGIFGAQFDVVFKKEYPLERCIGLDQDGSVASLRVRKRDGSVITWQAS